MSLDHVPVGSDVPDDVNVVIEIPMIRCRPIGMLAMTDEAGEDTKVIAVPIGGNPGWGEALQRDARKGASALLSQ